MTPLVLELQVLDLVINYYLEKTKLLLDSITIDKSLLAAHFHNTYNRAIENIAVALSVIKSLTNSN